MSNNTLTGIQSQMSFQLTDFAISGHVKTAFSKDTTYCITPDDLEAGFDIFLVIPEHKLDQWGKFFGLIAYQFMRHFEQRDPAKAQPILFLLDEFPRLGKVEGIASGLSTLRSRKITMAIVIQSLAQLDHIYGESQRQIIADNCAYKAVLGASEPKTQEYFTKLVGTYMELRQTTSSSTSKNPVGRFEGEETNSFWNPVHYKEYGSVSGSNDSVSYSYQRENVIQPHEFAHLKDIILLVSGKDGGYFRVKKTPYYEARYYIDMVDGKKIFEELEKERKLAAERETEKRRLAAAEAERMKPILAARKRKLEEENKREFKKAIKQTIPGFAILILLALIYFVSR
jgi:type IV secretion system protein VirD4